MKKYRQPKLTDYINTQEVVFVSENAMQNLTKISNLLADLPANALAIAAARLEGFSEGYAAATTGPVQEN